MENASKALYMAAATLIALLVLSLMVYMFRNAARVGENYDQQKGKENIDKFNSQFETLVTGDGSDALNSEDLKVATDVVTAVNLAYDVNKQTDYDNVEFVEIFVKDKRGNIIYSLKNDRSIKKNTMVKGENTSNGFITTNEFLKLKVEEGKYLSDVKFEESENKIIYRYYFIGNVSYDSRTGKVNKVEFTLKETENF